MLEVDTTRRVYPPVEIAGDPVIFDPSVTTFPAFHSKFITWRNQSNWTPQETTQRLLKCLVKEPHLLMETLRAQLIAAGQPPPQCRDHLAIFQVLAMKHWDPRNCQIASSKFLALTQAESESIHHYIIRYYEAMAGLSLTDSEYRQPLETGVLKKHHSLFQTIEVHKMSIDSIVSFLLDKIGMVEDPSLRQRGSSAVNATGHLTGPQTAMVNQVTTSNGNKPPFRFNRALDKAKADATAPSGLNKGGNPKTVTSEPSSTVDADKRARRRLNPDEYTEGATCDFCSRKNHTREQCRALKAQLNDALAQGVIKFTPRPVPPKKD